MRAPLNAVVAIGRAAVRWLLGDIPEMERRPESAALAVWVCCAAALGMYLGERHGVRGDPVLVGSWRMLAHGGVPLVAVALWEARQAWRAGSRAVVGYGLLLVGAAGLAALTAARFSSESLAVFTSTPGTTLAVPAIVAAALLLGGLRALDRDPGDWGIGLGDWRWWVPHHGVLAVGLVPVLVATTWLVPPLAAYYPTGRAARASLEGFGASHLGVALDFVGWEFLFRGFLLWGVARRGDPVLAILAQAVPFFLLHGNKPHVEMLSSFVGGIFAGWFCLRARSFLPLFVIHFVMYTVVGFTAYLIRHGVI